MATMNSLTDIWSVVMDSLSQELTQTAINTWFSDCTPIEINNNTLIVHTTSDFKRSIIQSRFEKTICVRPLHRRPEQQVRPCGGHRRVAEPRQGV